jgi:pimeloyl-ACP methyl ester carboxylesterase/DNA-binding CsgD family transcriptional regulator
MTTPTQLRQRVRYVDASDGTRLAWAESGDGPVIVKAANWLTHLEYEWESPVWKHWLQFFSAHWRFVRYDERGCGMSEWRGGLSPDQWAADLASVVDAARPSGPVTIFGISQGAATCINYAIRHPERVGRMVLYGGYARGGLRRGTPTTKQAYQAMADLARAAWGKDNPTFRQVFTSRFIPGGSQEQLRWFNDLCLKTISNEVAADLIEARGVVDVSASLADVRTPTLVLHARGDEAVPVAEARLLASGIPGAEFVELDSRNHILLAHEPAWERFCDAVLAFLQPEATAGGSVFAALSVRERQVLALMADGLSNADIAERLTISEKTVRNHASNLFDKLGVWSRAQAIVFAHDHGFSG